MLGIVLSAAGVYLRGRLTEQDLRIARYRHDEETPLDEKGEPLFWHQEYQTNPHRLNAAYSMIEELESQQTELRMRTLDRDKVQAEYEKVLDWCKKVKSEREELTYTQKRDFLYMLGATVLVY